MAIRYDLPTDSTGDLDLGIASMTAKPSDLKHQRDLFSSVAGEWKQFPQNGVGVPRYLKSTSNTTFLIIKNKATQQLKADGYIVKKINFSYDRNGVLNIDPVTSR